MKIFRTYFWISLLLVPTLVISGCDDDAPAAENEEEVIAVVRLTFTPAPGTDPTIEPVVFTYEDMDGDGIDEPTKISPALNANTTYTLDIEFEGPNGENITEEIDEEAGEHMIFFSWTEGYFSNPAGNGNIDSRGVNDVNYDDTDANGLPLGLSTTWTTGDAQTNNGTFSIMLKHQPDMKTATSTSNQGATDADISWTLMIQ